MRRSTSYHVAFYSLEALRNSAVLFALMGKFIHEGVTIDRFGIGPTEASQKTWLGLVALGISTVAGLSASVINYRHRDHYPAMQDVFATPLSGVYFFYFLDLVMNKSDNALSLPIFLLICALGLPSTMMLLSRFKTHDSSDQLVCTLDDLDNLTLVPNPNASPLAHRLNALRAAYYAASALTSVAWVIKREVVGMTQPLDPWMLKLTGLMLVPTLFIGNRLETHPKFFQGFAATAKGLRDAALIYAACSGYFFLLAVYALCDNQTFCLENSSRVILSYASIAITLMLGLFSAATTRFDFEKNTEKNIAAGDAVNAVADVVYRASDGCIDSARRAVVAVAECDVKGKISGCCEGVSDLFKTTRMKVTDYCRGEEADASVTTPFMTV